MSKLIEQLRQSRTETQREKLQNLCSLAAFEIEQLTEERDAARAVSVALMRSCAELKEALEPLRGISAQAFMDERDCMLKTQNELRTELNRAEEAWEEK